MSDLLRRMRREHRRFEGLLDNLEGNVEGFDAEQGPDWDDLDELLDFLRPGLSGRHHDDETRLYEYLAARPDGPRLFVEVLRAVQWQVENRAGDLEEALSSARQGHAPPADSLRSLAKEFSATLRHQIALEEHALFPLASTMLAPSDWHALARDH